MAPSSFEPSASIVSLIGRVSRLLDVVIQGEVAALGLSAQEFRILGLLCGESGTSQKDLAKKLAVAPATLSVALERLEQRSLIQRQVSADDGRVKLLSLGKRFDRGAASSIVQRLESMLLHGVRPADVEHLRKTLTLLTRNLDTSS